jgi:hypothetical protein
VLGSATWRLAEVDQEAQGERTLLSEPRAALTGRRSDVQYLLNYTSQRRQAVQTKLTLRLDEKLVRRAKAHARRTDRSVSQMVADYFALLGREPDSKRHPLTPTVESLLGALRGQKVSEKDYHRYLEEKYR